MLKNISQVKKYEQGLKKRISLEWLKTTLFLTIFFLICTTLVFSSDLNQDIQLKSDELPFEISERYYKKEAIIRFNQAVKDWEDKKVSDSIIGFNEALNIDPKLWVAYLGLGQAYYKEKEYLSSLNAYQKYLELVPSQSPDKEEVTKLVNFLSHILRYGENAVKGDDYLSLVKTKHEEKELYVRWNLSNPLMIYFYPGYPEEYEKPFLEGAMIWQEALPGLQFKVVDNSKVIKATSKEKEKIEKEILENVQIRVVFPSKFKVKGDPNNPIAKEIDAQSYPIIRDKKNFRVLGKIMISPYIYFQSQIAIPLEPLSKLDKDEQIKKVKLIAARETGHTLGLWGFSPNPDDLLFEGEITELKLSNRDKNTIKKLYKLEEVLTND